MPDETPPAEVTSPGRKNTADGFVLSPPPGPPIVADTASASGAKADDAVARALAAPPGGEVGIQYYEERRYETKVHFSPIPDPQTLRELAEIYPDAPKLIFEDMHAQSAHRRELEHLRMTTSATLAVRGQAIGGILGGIGLTGSLIVAGLGHGWAGFGIAMTSLVSLVSVFVYGQERQKKERADKAVVREKIKRGEPVETMEASSTSTGPSAEPRTEKPFQI